MAEFSQQLLGCRFHFETESAALHAALDFLRVSAQQDFALKREVRFRIVGESPPFTVLEDNAPAGEDLDTRAVVAFLYGRQFDHLQETETADVSLHGVCADVNGRRVLLCGESGGGKSTLATHLAFRPGFHVSGDDSLLLDAELRALPLPRRFMLRPGSRPLLPALADRWDELPALTNAEGELGRAFDPGLAGLDWEIAPRPVTAVVRLVRDGQPGWREVSSLSMVETLMRQTFACMTPMAHREWIARLGALVNAVPCHEYSTGDLERAASADLGTRLG